MPDFYCPKCKEKLNADKKYYVCKLCQAKYRHYVGIPNFKEQELYPGEWNLLEEAVKRYDELNFIQLMERLDTPKEKNTLPCELRRYLRLAEMDEAARKKWLADYTRNTIIKEGEKQLQITQKLISQADHQLKRGCCLDIGCGRGPWVVAANKLFDKTYALDVDMVSLILAQKYCQENQIPDIHFLSATSSALPFPDNYFDLVNSQAVLEHVDNQPNTLREINRVLQPWGCFTGDSVNRYNLFTPEPHIELRLVTFLPKSLAHRISLWLRKMPYDDIKPLSYKALYAMLQQAFGDRFQIIPFVETSERNLTHTVMKHLPDKFLDIFTHTHYIIAFKSNG
jgi:ubiquinone/menaquinone biosynthesis C-methylase UbiE